LTIKEFKHDNQKDNEKINELIKVLEKDPSIIAVAIYGSYARKESYRDIDICIFLHPDKIKDYTKIKMNYLGRFPDIFDIHYFNELPLYIQSRVLEEGIVVFDKDYNTLFDIYENTIKDYNLFEPHYRAFLGEN
jgi:predicted nucleotidyltransferase